MKHSLLFRFTHNCLHVILIAIAAFFISCSSREAAGPEGRVEFTLVQLNDIYEIGTLENGKFGGMARATTLIRQLEKENPNTFVLVAGDFLSPSVIGTVKLNGKRVAGAHMVDVMNAMGVDYVTFGNHEFDIKEDELQERINESKFEWIASNTKHLVHGKAVAFARSHSSTIDTFPEYAILLLKNAANKPVRVGMLGLTINSNRASFVQYEDQNVNGLRQYRSIQERCDAIIAITHLTIDQDKELAKEIPGIRLIIGGHEHNNMKYEVGNTIIAKADANARTVYIHRCAYDLDTKTLSIQSELKTIDESMPEDAAVAAVVASWTNRALEGFRALGFEPTEVVATVSTPLDGIENHIRTMQTNLGDFITQSMLAAIPDAEAAIMNSGSVRIDDEVQGKITQYDIIRILPFGGKILRVEMKGSLLQKILETGLQNKGSGGFLQTANINFNSATKSWIIKQAPLNPQATYRLAMNDFLLTGLEANLDFVTRKNPDIISVREPDAGKPNDLAKDLRLALIDLMKKKFR